MTIDNEFVWTDDDMLAAEDWDAYEDDDFDDTVGPIGIGTAVRAKRMPGVILRVYRYTRDGMADLHIVGDDASWIVDTDDLTVIDEDENICSCGQDGCGWG